MAWGFVAPRSQIAADMLPRRASPQAILGATKHQPIAGHHTRPTQTLFPRFEIRVEDSGQTFTILFPIPPHRRTPETGAPLTIKLMHHGVDSVAFEPPIRECSDVADRFFATALGKPRVLAEQILQGSHSFEVTRLS